MLANSNDSGEQSGEPERRIGRVLKLTVLGRRRVTAIVRFNKMNLKQILDKHPNENLRLTFTDGEVYVLKYITMIDPSVYGKKGQWSGEIVLIVHTNSKVIRNGNGLDFLESEVVSAEIVKTKN